MSKEWLLNSATSRFQLNYKRNVGAVSEEIRKCAPKNLDEWREYYFQNVRDENHLKELGHKLYVKITEVISLEMENVTECECINYIFNLVIDRTYQGYDTEIQTVYGHLQQKLECAIIKPAPDEWDRNYNVDFFIPINGWYIGIQVKPVSNVEHIPQIHKERTIQKETHALFLKKFGGHTFYIYSIKQDGKKIINNPEVIDEIRKEIIRLNKLAPPEEELVVPK